MTHERDLFEAARDAAFRAFSNATLDELSPDARRQVDRHEPPSQLIRDVLWLHYRENSSVPAFDGAFAAAEQACASYSEAIRDRVGTEIRRLLAAVPSWR